MRRRRIHPGRIFHALEVATFSDAGIGPRVSGIVVSSVVPMHGNNEPWIIDYDIDKRLNNERFSQAP
jgi:hypothetical protein